MFHQAALLRPRVHLDVLRRHHLELVKRFLGLDPGIFTLDLFITAVARRSYHLVDGFLALFDEWNVIGAAPILRMQLDNLTRLSYVCRAPQAELIADAVLEGVEFRHMKDAEGKRLLDGRLVELAAEHHPWLPLVYGATSGWVHLSPVHLYTSWKVSDEGGRPMLSTRFPGDPHEIPVSALDELVGAMVQATEEVFGYIELWERRKGLPPGQMRTLGAVEPS